MNMDNTLKQKDIAYLPSDKKIEVYKKKGAKIGDKVQIGLGTVLLGNLKRVEIGSGTIIGGYSKFVFEELKIGKNVKINNNADIRSTKIQIDDGTVFENYTYTFQTEIEGGGIGGSNLSLAIIGLIGLLGILGLILRRRHEE